MDSRTQVTLVEQTSMEVADVARTRDALVQELDIDMSDGIITPAEAARIKRIVAILIREVDEAVLVAKEASYVEKENDFRSKRGINAKPHYYLQRELREVQAMGGLLDYPPKRPTPAGAVMRLTVKRKAPTVGPVRAKRTTELSK